MDMELLDICPNKLEVNHNNHQFEDSDEEDKIDADQSPLLIRQRPISANEIEEIMRDIREKDHEEEPVNIETEF